MALNVSDIEEHFINRLDQDASVDQLLKEFAAMVDINFQKIPSRGYVEDDSYLYGVFVGPRMWTNLYYDEEEELFGFQMFTKEDGKIQGMIKMIHGCDIIDLFMRLAINMGKFAR